MASRASKERPRSQIIEAPDEERHSFINHPNIPWPRWAKKSPTSVFNKVMAIVNLALGLILATSIGLIAYGSNKSCSRSASPIIEPSPASEAVVPIIKKFYPDHLFQSGNFDAIEAAWSGIEGVNGGLVVLGSEDSKRLSKASYESIALTSHPEKHIYGISIYQQLRCLNIIRKSFHRNTFFPSFKDDRFQNQKNDCFDFLRQAIQCHGDVSMTYFWNETMADQWDERDDAMSGYEDINLGAETRFLHFWDVEHSCRALEPIEQWVAEHQV